jgi:PAS domain S-box-containing protein
LWFYAGAALAAAQALGAWLLRGSPDLRTAFGDLTLIVAASMPAVVVYRRRHEWRGCQAVFWTTIGIGALAWAIGQIAWTANEVLFHTPLPWLRWYALLNLVGSIAPLLALHARPHRGPRRADAAIIGVDIAGLAIIVAYLYLFFVIGPGNVEPSTGPPTLLLRFTQAQRLLLLAGMIATLVSARHSEWSGTFRRLAIAAAIGLIGRLVVNAAIARSAYYTGSPLDLAWSLPFLIYAWAAAKSPASSPVAEDEVELSLSSAPWLIFSVLTAVPLTELLTGTRSSPSPRVQEFREIASNSAMLGLLALLAVRVAVERAARRDIKDRLRLMAAAVQQTDDLTLIIRNDDRVHYANSAFSQALGYSSAELVRLAPEALIAADAQKAFRELMARARNGQVARGTLTRIRKDGTTFMTSVTAVPLMNARGELSHLVAVERDITDDLRRRDQLIHAERLSAVGQLVSGVAHEINNPLQAIVGFTEIMLGTEQRRESRRDLERIFTEANRAGKIVRNLLAFVRRSSHARTRDDLNDIVQATISLRAYELRVAGIELVEQYDAALPAVFVNREEIQQVILNLVLNAEQAMLSAHKRGRLTIATRRLDDQVYVDVTDDGPGVPAAIAGKIFEPFFTTKAVGQGTGLGLSIGMGIAESHGGCLGLVNIADRGARFRLTLPALDGARLRSTTAERRSPPLTIQSRSALVVDDEPAVRDLVGRMLRRRGYVVDIAEDGEEALALAGKNEYALMVCDVKMPRMRGVDVFERIRAIAPGLSERFVFVTGDAVAPDIADMAAAHGIPLLAKPFTSADLDNILGPLDREPSTTST